MPNLLGSYIYKQNAKQTLMDNNHGRRGGGFKYRRVANCLPESLICCPNELLSSRLQLQLYSVKIITILQYHIRDISYPVRSKTS